MWPSPVHQGSRSPGFPAKILVKSEEWVSPLHLSSQETHGKGGQPEEDWGSSWSEVPQPTTANNGCCLRTALKKDHVC